MEGAGSWRRLHKEELRNLYASPSDQIKKDEMGGAYSMDGIDDKCLKYFGGCGEFLD
jgi:hypothetical protein